MTYYDKHGREIKAGDVLKVYHFTAALRRQIFMYKLVMAGDAQRQLTPDGEYLYGIDCREVAEGVSPHDAHKYLIREDQLHSEIIDGGTVHGNDLWWERPRR